MGSGAIHPTRVFFFCSTTHGRLTPLPRSFTNSTRFESQFISLSVELLRSIQLFELWIFLVILVKKTISTKKLLGSYKDRITKSCNKNCGGWQEIYIMQYGIVMLLTYYWKFFGLTFFIKTFGSSLKQMCIQWFKIKINGNPFKLVAIKSSHIS